MKLLVSYTYTRGLAITRAKAVQSSRFTGTVEATPVTTRDDKDIGGGAGDVDVDNNNIDFGAAHRPCYTTYCI